MRIATEPSRALSVQSGLVAGVCALTDSLMALLAGRAGCWQAWAVLGLVVLVDLGLAGPARHSGLMAAAHGAVQVLASAVNSPGNDAGLMIAGYRAGAWLAGWPAWTALGLLVVTRVAAQLVRRPETWHFIPVVILTGAVLPWLVGRYTTARRAHLADLEQRAERERRDAEQALAEAISRERSAIARDLHDVIAHHVSAINLHAGAARLTLTGQEPGAVASSLSAVESASQAAMVDLRHLLDLLHGDNGDGARQPGLSNLEELFDGVRAAGVPARLVVSGDRAVPESLGITVYRIIQEMLTNAVRHGDSGGVQVSLSFLDSALEVTAANTVPGGQGALGGGRGLAGIEARASMFGGVAGYGLTADGRWRVSVRFPLEVPV